MKLNLFIFVIFIVIGKFSIVSVSAVESKLNFEPIKDILLNDSLESATKNQSGQKSNFQVQDQKPKKDYFKIPARQELLSILSELWIVKNAPILKWDFEKPDFGIENDFSQLLEKMGYYESKFKILYLNSPTVTHFGLPGTDESILLISLPFIRQMDLSKPEIALILFEDFIRLKQGYTERFMLSEIEAIMDKSVKDNPASFEKFKTVLKKMDTLIYEKGFDFQQQFDVTQMLSRHLKNDLNLWGIYIELLKKIDSLVKSNFLYKDYTRIYPSPEMQIKWLGPKT